MKTAEETWLEEGNQAMQGWNFEHLDGRWKNESLPWNYSKIVQRYLQATDIWLDMDTGGGELMTSFQHDSQRTYITEGWDSNIEFLKQKVVPSGVTLYEDPTENLNSVPDNKFDIVTNCHGAMPVPEISRVLKESGMFVTEQVGATNNFFLSRFFRDDYQPAYPDNTLVNNVIACQKVGLKVLKSDVSFSKMSFFDVGAVVYYATVIPWEFPNFDVRDNLSKLYELQNIIDQTGQIDTYEDRFLIVASKQ
ncbi:methyltransferase [Companilactobacillus paralimentarius DSM 13238 = JCM 10415]|uniref:Methyltransferase n=1 Tax=Companilactobacillus paralimentarius DSM 13238 = JCM 10415 TaxID=1122151 RepID=A0A0R1PF91_9LACO|nr:methyltransferase domain-containing protein [Companilactobacillus paralimentarius]KAE9563240.1 SAM-dependent methyltransferase [Companilactobacillus paralimentarius]KRL31152.1 methyltransferase [Companilactobacillus paralimentarius DSM 13238 = JCM 10415]MDR4934215.1 methyltransferase domain-containing protein [Companilactobacillus paralimentarius]QFR70583.1 methyltransferase domain-containing protein [Companilactobacillus paralimentarius]